MGGVNGEWGAQARGRRYSGGVGGSGAVWFESTPRPFIVSNYTSRLYLKLRINICFRAYDLSHT